MHQCFFQATMAVPTVAVAVMLGSQWNKNDKINRFLFWFILAQSVAQGIALLRSW
jgi:hypothetical protein